MEDDNEDDTFWQKLLKIPCEVSSKRLRTSSDESSSQTHKRLKLSDNGKQNIAINIQMPEKNVTSDSEENSKDSNGSGRHIEKSFNTGNSDPMADELFNTEVELVSQEVMRSSQNFIKCGDEPDYIRDVLDSLISPISKIRHNRASQESPVGKQIKTNLFNSPDGSKHDEKSVPVKGKEKRRLIYSVSGENIQLSQNSALKINDLYEDALLLEEGSSFIPSQKNSDVIKKMSKKSFSSLNTLCKRENVEESKNKDIFNDSFYTYNFPFTQLEEFGNETSEISCDWTDPITATASSKCEMKNDFEPKRNSHVSKNYIRGDNERKPYNKFKNHTPRAEEEEKGDGNNNNEIKTGQIFDNKESDKNEKNVGGSPPESSRSIITLTSVMKMGFMSQPTRMNPNEAINRSFSQNTGEKLICNEHSQKMSPHVEKHSSKHDLFSEVHISKTEEYETIKLNTENSKEIMMEEQFNESFDKKLKFCELPSNKDNLQVSVETYPEIVGNPPTNDYNLKEATENLDKKQLQHPLKPEKFQEEKNDARIKTYAAPILVGEAEYISEDDMYEMNNAFNSSFFHEDSNSQTYSSQTKYENQLVNISKMEKETNLPKNIHENIKSNCQSRDFQSQMNSTVSAPKVEEKMTIELRNDQNAEFNKDKTCSETVEKCIESNNRDTSFEFTSSFINITSKQQTLLEENVCFNKEAIQKWHSEKSEKQSARFSSEKDMGECKTLAQQKFNSGNRDSAPALETSINVSDKITINSGKLSYNEIENKKHSKCNLTFTTASGKSVKISDKSLEDAKKMLDSENDTGFKSESLIESNFGYPTASNKPINGSNILNEVKFFETSEEDKNDFLKTHSKYVSGSNKNVLKFERKECTKPEFGFSTATGKPVKVSEKSLACARNILNENNIEFDETTHEQCFGFLTTSEKTVLVSEENLLHSGNSLSDQRVALETKSSKDPNFIPIMGTGNSIKIGETSLTNAKKMEKDNVNNEFQSKCFEETKFGFLTAGGKPVEVSEKSLLHARNILNEVTDEIELNDVNGKKKSNILKDHSNILNTKKHNFTFSAASGKSIGVSEKSLADAKKVLDCMSDEFGIESVKEPKFGFSTAGGKQVKVSEKSLVCARSILNEANNELANVPNLKSIMGTGISNEIEGGSSSGVMKKEKEHINNDFQDECFRKPKFDFSTAGGKTIKVSEKSLLCARNILNEVTDELDPTHFYPKNKSNMKDDSDIQYPKHHDFIFSTAAGKSIGVSEKSLSDAKKVLDGMSDEFETESFKEPKFGFSTAGGKQVKVSEKSLACARSILNEVSNELTNVPNLKSIKGTGNSNKIVGESLIGVMKMEKEHVSNEFRGDRFRKPTFGFSTAGGKTIKVSEKSLLSARNILSEVTDELDQTHFDAKNESNIMKNDSDIQNPKRHDMFSTAGVKSIGVSQKCLANAKEILDGVNEGYETESLEVPKFGFSTAGGKQVKVSEQCLNQARTILNEVSDLSPQKQDPSLSKFSSSSVSSLKNNSSNLFNIDKNHLDKKPHHPKFGFATANGKNVEISEENVRKAKKIFTEISDKFEGESIEMNNERRKDSPMLKKAEHQFTEGQCFGFATATGKSISVSEKYLSIARKMLNDDDSNTKSHEGQSLEFTPEPDKSINPVTNYPRNNLDGKIFDSTNDGVPYKSSVKEKNSILREMGDELQEAKSIENGSVNKAICGNESSVLNSKCTETLDSTSKNKNRPKNYEGDTYNNFDIMNLSCDLDVWNDFESQFDMLGVNKNKTMKEAHQDFNFSSTQDCDMSLSVAHEISESAAALLADDETSEKNWSIPYVTSPSFLVDRQIRRESAISLDEDFNFDSKKENKIQDIPKEEITEDCSMSEKILNLVDSQLSPVRLIKNSRKRSVSNEISLSPPVKRKKNSSESTESDAERENILAWRLEAIKEQETQIEKKHSSEKPVKGSNLLIKECKNNRIPFKDAVSGNTPMPYNTEELLSYGVHYTGITVSNALDFTFSAEDFYRDYDINATTGISVGDGGLLILDQDDCAGRVEIGRTFLSLPGVDPALVPPSWIDNHYKWIVWKLASMERSFPKYFAGRCLTPDNLMRQLKYRYDREIDKAERPALRKILEGDEPPSRRMVLCICAIKIGIDKSVSLELTDGWYSVWSSSDSEMERLIQKHTINIGTKIVISGAELLNWNQGVDPLQIGENVKLRFSTNSTRRVKWYTKLGFCPVAKPLLVKLGAILQYGGAVGRVRATIVRAYPMLYMSKEGDKTVFRSSKAENKEAAKHEKLRSEKAEAIYQRVWTEMEKEFKKKDKKLTRQSSKQLPKIMNPDILCSIIDQAVDPSAIEGLLSPDQLKIAQKYREERFDQMMREVHEKVKKELVNAMPERNSTPLLKLRIIDLEKEVNAMLTIWRPSEDLISILTEMSSFEFQNLKVSSSRNRQLQLSSTRQTYYNRENINGKKDNKYKRQTMRIPEIMTNNFYPVFGEFDSIGLVVSVEKNASTIVKVHLADKESDQLLTISLWPSVCISGLEDILVEGNLVYVVNIQWRSGALPFATEATEFSRAPRNNNDFQSLKKYFEQKDIKEYVRECQNVLENLSEPSACSTPKGIYPKISRYHLGNAKHHSGTKLKTNDDNLRSSTDKNIFRTVLEGKKCVLETKYSPLRESLIGGSISVSGIDEEVGSFDGNEDTPARKRLRKLEWYGNPPSISPLHRAILTTDVTKDFKSPVRSQSSSESPPLSL